MNNSSTAERLGPTYHEYWRLVFGARTADGVVHEFQLTPGQLTLFLRQISPAIWRVYSGAGEPSLTWRRHEASALGDLLDACRADTQ
jgi:hypothetical protein